VTQFDHVVVGAGPAGVCARPPPLRGPDVDVLFVEAGGEDARRSNDAGSLSRQVGQVDGRGPAPSAGP
jgi:choline dehydrogenase-like flavoprotein